MTAASPFPLSPDHSRPAGIAILLALALHAAVPLALLAFPLLAPSPRNDAAPPEVVVEVATLREEPAPAPPPPPPEPPREAEPEAAQETPRPPPLPEIARLLDPPPPLLEQAPIGDVSRAAPGPDAEPAPAPPPAAAPPASTQPAPPAASEAAPPAIAEAAPLPEPEAAAPAAVAAPAPARPAQEDAPVPPPQQQAQRQQPQRPADRPAERKPPQAKPPEAGKARVDAPATGGRGRDAQRSASSSEARQQSEGDFVLAQIMPFWLIDKRSPRFRDVVMGGVFALQADGTLASPFGKNDPWRPEIMIENYRDLLKPQAEPVRVALESFLRAARDAQPFELPPGARGGYPRAIRITFKMGDL